MGSSFIITMREGLEAALVIGIILGYLARAGQDDGKAKVIVGTVLGVAASILTAYVFQRVLGGFEGRSEQLFEGILMMTAVALITPMFLWMQRQGKAMSGHVKDQVNQALHGQRVWGLVGLAFVSVYREGVETVLFMHASAIESGWGAAFWGGLVGIAGAIVLAFLIFSGSKKVDLAVFFKATGAVLLLFAAGLFSHGLHELQEASILPSLIEHVWNTSFLLDENSTVGSFIKTLLGYRSSPSLLDVIGYMAYLLGVGRVLLTGQGRALRPLMRVHGTN